MKRVLALNVGSSSLKYGLFEPIAHGERCVQRGERAGLESGGHSRQEAVCMLLDELDAQQLLPVAVGHRLVHGGEAFAEPVVVDTEVFGALQALVPFAPLHLPAELAVIEAVRRRLPACPQVACFDTAFHRTMSVVARRYALPASVTGRGVCRYGFHGLSYEYVVAEVGAQALGRAIVCHLGSGASMAAIRSGESVDTTMGFSPAGGLVMATRAGDLDPGLVLHLLRQGVDHTGLDDLINRRGGLLGVSGTTGDVRELLSQRAHDERAALAIAVFVWSARKWIGALTATLGGIDTLVFTGGVGENSAIVRGEICDGLSHLGVYIDPQANAQCGTKEGTVVIGASAAPCSVLVLRTDEERVIARRTREATRMD